MRETTVRVPKDDSPPPYTCRTVATTPASNRSCVNGRMVERIEGNGYVYQKEVAFKIISE